MIGRGAEGGAHGSVEVDMLHVRVNHTMADGGQLLKEEGDVAVHGGPRS